MELDVILIIFSTSNKPRAFKTFAIVPSCAEYIHNARFGYRVELDFMVKRSKISLNRKPAFKRANNFVFVAIVKQKFANFSMSLPG